MDLRSEPGFWSNPDPFLQHRERGLRLRHQLLVALLLLCSTVAGQEAEIRDEIRGGAAPVDLSRIGASDLLWKSPDGLVPLPMGGLEIELTVTGVMVHGRISQWFHNPTDEVIEALYVFPMPERAAVHHMELVIGERRRRSFPSRFPSSRWR